MDLDVSKLHFICLLYINGVMEGEGYEVRDYSKIWNECVFCAGVEVNQKENDEKLFHFVSIAIFRLYIPQGMITQ